MPRDKKGKITATGELNCFRKTHYSFHFTAIHTSPIIYTHLIVASPFPILTNVLQAMATVESQLGLYCFVLKPKCTSQFSSKSDGHICMTGCK